MKQHKLLQFTIIVLMLPALLISCGGGNDEAKTSKNNSSGSGITKMISMATSSLSELQKIEAKAKSETDINKLTKMAEDFAKKEEELNKKFVDYVSKEAGSMKVPVDQNINQEFFSTGSIEVLSAESLNKITMKIQIKALKTPFPSIDDRVYLKLVDKNGNMTQKLLVPKPFGKKDISEWDWSPLMNPAIFTGVTKAVVITEDEFKQL